MDNKFNHEEPNRFLQYLDANNLYGWAMSKLLPTRGFRWVHVNPNDINELVKHKKQRLPARGRCQIPERVTRSSQQPSIYVQQNGD